MQFNSLIPELTVSNLKNTKQFYVEMLGFKVEYERKADKFAFISLGDVQFMLEEYHKDGWNVAEMKKPFGRGISFSIETDSIDDIYKKLISNNYPLFRPMMSNQYESNGKYIEQSEFLVQDPDGYLLRFTHE